jgi:phosphopantothenoylcysteine synthetase/decarboxylase
MGSADNAVTIIARDGAREELAKAPKDEIADGILSAALKVWQARQQARAAS